MYLIIFQNIETALGGYFVNLYAGLIKKSFCAASRRNIAYYNLEDKTIWALPSAESDKNSNQK